MAASKATPRPTLAPVLENFHTVSAAAVRLSLRDEGEEGQRGEKWLRDGANRPKDGSKGEPFPHHRLAGRLMFSDSDLAEIAAMNRQVPQRRGRARRTLQSAA